MVNLNEQDSKEITKMAADNAENISIKKLTEVQKYADNLNALLSILPLDFLDQIIKGSYLGKGKKIKLTPQQEKEKKSKAQDIFIKELKEININKENKTKKEQEELYSMKYRYVLMFLFYIAQNEEEYFSQLTFENIFSSDNFIKKYIKLNSDKKITKEVIINFYKFNPFIETNKDIEKKIDKCKYTEFDKEKEDNEKQNLKDIDISINQNKDLKNEISNLKNNIKQYQINNKNLEKVNKQLKNEIEELKKQQNNAATSITKTDLEELDKLKQENDEVKTKNKELERENRKSLTRENLRKKWNEIKERAIRKIENNPELQRICIQAILRNDDISKRIINMLGLEQQLIENGHKYYEEQFKQEIEKIEELHTEKENIIKEIKHNKTISNNMQNISSNIVSTNNCIPNVVHNEIFKFNASQNAIINYENNNKYMDKLSTKTTIMILNNREFIDKLNCAQLGIPVCEVYPESNWSCVEDWFGKYVGKTFIPAKTNVSDYYKFINTNTDIPFGLIIFNNFNKILPDFYLEAFVNKIANEKEYTLINDNIEVDDNTYKVIKRNPKLHYILIKSQDEYAFDIPTSMKKYEFQE